MEISVILALLICEHGIFSHLFVSSSIFSSMSYSFQCVYIYIYIYLYLSFSWLNLPLGILLFMMLLWVGLFLSFSDSLLLVYRYGTNFFMLNFFFFFKHCSECRILGSPTRDQTHTLQWKHRVLTSGLPGKSLCMLILYPEILLHLFVLTIFLRSLGFIKKIISADRENFTFFFQFGCFLFYFFPCLITLTRASSTVLNRSGESEHACLISDLSGKMFSLFR